MKGNSRIGNDCLPQHDDGDNNAVPVGELECGQTSLVATDQKIRDYPCVHKTLVG